MFFKPRPIPFTLKEKIAEELSRLERVGVLEKVEFSDWATPIIPVLKPDGSVRICGDYKVTINPVLDVSKQLMPTADGREKFSKLDLSSAYQPFVRQVSSQPTAGSERTRGDDNLLPPRFMAVVIGTTAFVFVVIIVGSLVYRRHKLK